MQHCQLKKCMVGLLLTQVRRNAKAGSSATALQDCPALLPSHLTIAPLHMYAEVKSLQAADV